ncbi:cache domain-containing protein [Brevibacillus humidisoli]|uniref:HD domain-containing phosphohydrolase n=1 Tax=Brevibacillus humidisoli TaxID=2895522 RepID=UPI001E64A797|nr:HD domain-containing phosphohydrolase [Brevibacillus humidisoli]UFJ41576.1 cache domain-containing protein [Brevibacillus humidisoli]
MFTSFPRKLYPIFLILLPVLFSLIVFWGYSYAKQQYYAAGIRSLDRQLSTVIHVVELTHRQVENGQLTLVQAQKKVKDLLTGPLLPDGTRDSSAVDITIGPGDYLFALNSSGYAAMHPHLEGKNLLSVANPEGRYIAKELLSKPFDALHYLWENPIDSEPHARISLVRYYAPWDWYIGISTDEDNFYIFYKPVKALLIILVAGSYVIAAILLFLARRKERALQRSTQMSKQLAETNQSVLKTLAVALEERDAYTSGHSQRVAYYMKQIARQMGFPEQEMDALYMGGLLHDIGKIGVEDSILQKTGQLTDTEYEVIKTHPVRGEALLRKLYANVNKHDRKKVDLVLTITRSHHERFDGKGYPDGLVGEAIPLAARIATVADSFDAMTSIRSYRRGLSYSKACEEIRDNTGTQFCPQVAAAFFEGITEETFYLAHQITTANEMLFESDEEEANITGAYQTAT